MACDINKVIIQTNNIFEKMFGNALELVECFKNKFEFETTIISQRLLCYNPQNEKLSNYNNKKNPKYNESITKLCDTIKKYAFKIEEEQNNIDLWKTLFYCYMLLNDYANAHSSIGHITKTQSYIDDPYFLYCKGIVYGYFDYYYETINIFTSIPVNNVSFSSDLKFRMSLVLRELKRYDEALLLLKSLDFFPLGLNNYDILFQVAYTNQLKNCYSTASKIYSNLLDVPTANKIVKNQIIWFYSNQNDEQNLLKGDSYAAYINDPICKFSGSIISLKLNNPVLAYSRLHDCYNELKDSPFYWLAMGNLYVKNNQLNDACQAFHKSLSLKNDINEIWLNVGLIYELQNEIPNSIKAYQNGISVCKNTYLLQERLRNLNASNGKTKHSIIKDFIYLDPQLYFPQPIEEINKEYLKHIPFLDKSCFKNEPDIQSCISDLIVPYYSLF